VPIWLPLSVLSQKCNMVHFKWIWRFAYHGRFIGQFFWRSYCPFHLEYFNNSYILNRNFSKLHDCFLPNEDLKYCKGSFIWPFFKQFLAFLHLQNMKEYGGWHLFMSKVTFLNIFFYFNFSFGHQIHKEMLMKQNNRKPIDNIIVIIKCVICVMWHKKLSFGRNDLSSYVWENEQCCYK
jgi:hypothetical protein